MTAIDSTVSVKEMKGKMNSSTSADKPSSEGSNDEVPVTIKDHVKRSEVLKSSSSPRSFEYNLSDKAAKGKLIKAAKRSPALKVEENSTSSNIVFSCGAWKNAVLPALKYWSEAEGDKTCKVGDFTVVIGGIKGGVEKSGKHVDSQVIFFAHSDKVVCHLYNTTCLILVNGQNYRKLIELFLVPFFQTKIESSKEEIEMYNEMVLEKLGAKKIQRSDIK